ncbi:hypothetical protein CGLO_11449 [Colletotrichum gloeosporioides Cg-14]|uniref:Uncharacterized protein n=1 Tax=Colletotrichum gloeosporioides (strain Cg-14) TaxID=1237896 RepID=T0KB05_COLGC|nr:hypothetical protein CGLO_11449 [Colletotrichum gloeosporioides Cg-14]
MRRPPGQPGVLEHFEASLEKIQPGGDRRQGRAGYRLQQLSRTLK